MLRNLNPKTSQALLAALSKDETVAPRLAVHLSEMRDSIAAGAAKDLKSSMSSASSRCRDCDDAGNAMEQFPARIRAFATSFPEKKALTWDLCLAMIKGSYVDPDMSVKACGYGESTFREGKGDDFCVNILTILRREGYDCEIKSSLDNLKRTGRWLAKYGVPFYPKTIKLLRRLVQEEKEQADEED